MKQALGKLTRNDELSNSLLAAAMGKSQWQTPNEVLKNCHDASKGIDISIDPTAIMEVGNYLEKPLIELAAKRVGLLQYFDEINKPVRHKNVALNGSLDAIGVADNLVITPDVEKGFYVPEGQKVICNGKGVMEIKVTAARPESVPIDSRGVLQCKGLMACTEFNWAMLCILYGTDYRIFFYQRDQKWEEDILVPFVQDFDSRIKDLNYYDPFNTNDAKGMFPLDNNETIELPDNAADLVSIIESSEQNIKKLTESIEQAKTSLMAMLKTAAVGYTKDRMISWKTINYKAKPEQVKTIPAKEAYTQRRFTIKKINEETKA
tara:strand:- start:3382 stop:4341 length:960 start_codon:yes stop_codon:yes gene_type:complete